jgi:hypothetical protein
VTEELRKKIERCVDELEPGTVTRLDWMTPTEFMLFMQELANERNQGKGDPEGGDEPVRGSPDDDERLPAAEDDLHAAEEDAHRPDATLERPSLPAGAADADISVQLVQAQGLAPGILQQPQGEETMKAGVKTTEFWMTIGAAVLGLLVSLEVIGTEDMDAILKVIALILGLLPAAAYNLSRGLAKMGRDD